MSMLRSAATAVAAIAICHASLAGGLTFKYSPLMAGRASLTEDGFRISRSLGTANFTPELSYPVEITYQSFQKRRVFLVLPGDPRSLSPLRHGTRMGFCGRLPGARR